MQLQKIDIVDYLERIPDGYVTKRQELLQKYKGLQASQQAAAPPIQDDGSIIAQAAEEEAIPTGGRYSELQRKINEEGIV